jgi:uncharacterized protein (TIGR02118 family)
MFKLIGYWTAPPKTEDLAAFEDLYLNRHCPKAAEVPHVKRVITTRVEEGLEGGPITHFRVAEMIFEDKAAYEAATKSPEFAAMRADAEELVEQFGVSVTGETGAEVDHVEA